MARNELLEKLLGKKQAAAATDAVAQLDEALEGAGVEHKALDAESMDAGEVADAMIDVIKSELSEDEKRAAIVEVIKDLMPADVLTDAEKKAHKPMHEDDMSDEDMPPDDEDDEDDDDDDNKRRMGKGLELVAKMVDDLGAITEAQLQIESQFKGLGERIDALEALNARLNSLETVVTKTLKARPRIASRAPETVVENGDLTDGMKKDMEDYEISPLGLKVRKGV